MKLGKTQKRTIILLPFIISFMYLARKQLEIGGGFSEGIYAGFFLGLTFVYSATITFLVGRMIYLNFKIRLKKEDVK